MTSLDGFVLYGALHIIGWGQEIAQEYFLIGGEFQLVCPSIKLKGRKQRWHNDDKVNQQSHGSQKRNEEEITSANETGAVAGDSVAKTLTVSNTGDATLSDTHKDHAARA